MRKRIRPVSAGSAAAVLMDKSPLRRCKDHASGRFPPSEQRGREELHRRNVLWAESGQGCEKSGVFQARSPSLGGSGGLPEHTTSLVLTREFQMMVFKSPPLGEAGTAERLGVKSW